MTKRFGYLWGFFLATLPLAAYHPGHSSSHGLLAGCRGVGCPHHQSAGAQINCVAIII